MHKHKLMCMQTIWHYRDRRCSVQTLVCFHSTVCTRSVSNTEFEHLGTIGSKLFLKHKVESQAEVEAGFAGAILLMTTKPKTATPPIAAIAYIGAVMLENCVASEFA